MKRGTENATAYTKEAYHQRMVAALKLAKKTKLTHVPAADQLTADELFMLQNAWMRAGNVEVSNRPAPPLSSLSLRADHPAVWSGQGGTWCTLQFGEEPPKPEPKPAAAAAGDDHAEGGHH